MRHTQILICLLVAAAMAPNRSAAVGESFGQSLSDRQPTTLSEPDFEVLRGRVLSRCHVAPGVDPARAPWYFHYELGLELEKRGDARRALDALIEATQLRPEPRRSARMYGMWFTEYRPYFEIAKMHFALGNRQCAADALRISAGEREVTEGDEAFVDFQKLESALVKGSKSN
jgi:hypothetical protein